MFRNTPTANLAGPIGNGVAIALPDVKIISHPGIRPVAVVLRVRVYNMLWTVVIVVIVIAVVGGWYAFEAWWDRRLFSAAPGQVCANLNAKQASAYLSEHPETQVLDVRSAAEFGSGALPQAVNVSIGDKAFDEKLAQHDRDKPVLVYCAGGFRSRKAVDRLKQLGFKNIQHLHRGYMSWKPAARSH